MILWFSVVLPLWGSETRTETWGLYLNVEVRFWGKVRFSLLTAFLSPKGKSWMSPSYSIFEKRGGRTPVRSLFNCLAAPVSNQSCRPGPPERLCTAQAEGDGRRWDLLLSLPSSRAAPGCWRQFPPVIHGWLRAEGRSRELLTPPFLLSPDRWQLCGHVKSCKDLHPFWMQGWEKVHKEGRWWRCLGWNLNQCELWGWTLPAGPTMLVIVAHLINKNWITCCALITSH